MPISRQVQAGKGDVTEAADEAVVGIEMVQAFGREDDVRTRFGGKAAVVRDIVVRQAGVEAKHLPALFFLPTISIAAVVFFGGRDVIDGRLTIGQFVLFNTILLQLTWPLEALGWILNLAQRAIASAGRTFAWLEEVQRLPEPDDPRELPRRAADRRVRGRPLRLPGRGRGAVRRRHRPSPRRDRRGVRADRRGQEHASEPAAAVLRPHRRPCAGRRRGRARRAARDAARRGRGDHPAADPVLDHPAREPHRRSPGRRLRRGRGDVPRGRRRATSCPTCPTATTP